MMTTVDEHSNTFDTAKAGPDTAGEAQSEMKTCLRCGKKFNFTQGGFVSNAGYALCRLSCRGTAPPPEQEEPRAYRKVKLCEDIQLEALEGGNLVTLRYEDEPKPRRIMFKEWDEVYAFLGRVRPVKVVNRDLFGG